MNIRQASYVLEILKAGNISAAAKRLYISQPALSQTLRLAEDSLGTKIFKRGTSPLALTYAGEKYVEAARRIMEINGNLINEISEINNEKYGRLRFAISPQRGLVILPVALPEFREKYPNVDIEIGETTSGPIETMLIMGETDIALATTSTKKPELTYYELEQTSLVLLCAPDTEVARKYKDSPGVDISVAANENFIALKPGRNQRILTERVFAAAGVGPRINIEVDSYETGKRLAVTCSGVMICNSAFLHNMRRMGESGVVIPLKTTGFEQSFYLCHRRDLYLTKYMQDWIDIIMKRSATAFGNG